MARLLDRLTLGNSSGNLFVRLWDKVCTQIENLFANQQSQIDTINAMLDDDTLTPDKKPVWIFIYSVLAGEQAALDTEAATYGITTEKTNYDNALSALATYLATLTTAVAWDNLTGNTAIVGTTFRSNFNDVLVKKQALLNKMHDKAKTLADTAQTQANTATTNAATAQTTANTGVANAATAQTTANTGVTNAATAQGTANTAVTNAATAQTTADAVTKTDKLSGGWTSPGSVLSAADAGSDATITIAGHTRYYGDGTNVSVTGGSLTALAYSTTYYIYYDNAGLAGGAQTYHSTTDANVGAYNKAAGRHALGKIATPAALGSPTSGGVTPPGGYTGPGDIP